MTRLAVTLGVPPFSARCLLSADERTFGGVAPFESSKWNQRPNLAVVRGTGEFYWDRGLIAEPTTPPVAVDSGT